MAAIKKTSAGFTMVELLVTLAIFGIVFIGVLNLYVTLQQSTLLAKRRAVASTLAVNQMEYLKSLPYDDLAVSGGSIYSANPLPASTNQTVNGFVYVVKTSINYVDDAYDGCASYPTQALKELYCRNYPAPAGAPSPDTNPQDYKVAHVSVLDKGNKKLAEVDTQVSARVSETASTTGALFVKVIDGSGNPISGATVAVNNTTTTPVTDLSDSTDSNGIAIFYGMTPDSNNYDYKITASKLNYSTLFTIIPNGTLQPTYPNQKVFSQQPSYVTLTIKPQSANSLVLESTNTSGAALANAKIYIKGGYKKYTATTDTSYYYDTLSPSDTRPTTDASGLAAVSNLVPGNYIFCGDSGATSCSVGGTTYYLAAAVPYGGSNAFNPITVPTYDSASPPSTTYSYNGSEYLQKVRLMLTTSSSFPRVNTLTPSTASLASGLNSFAFIIAGNNLPCNSNPNNCNTTVSLKQGSTTFAASCTGSNAGTQLTCTSNLSTAVPGIASLVITANGNTLTLPGSPLLGGVIVTL